MNKNEKIKCLTESFVCETIFQIGLSTLQRGVSVFFSLKAFRRNVEGTVFTGVCLFTFGGGGIGGSHTQLTGGTAIWLTGGWCYPVWLTREVPPSGYWGVPDLANGGCTLIRSTGRRTPSGQWRVPPIRNEWGYPTSGQDGGIPLRQSSRASTCYVVGDMPLSFTQEDFLV